MANRSDTDFMSHALDLARKGRGKTSPNPMVGAVLVRRGRIIAEGYHRRVGTDHAEIVALKKAGAKARGADLYVTLEPCCHTGHTGPCTEAIIAAGVKRVVFSSTDPDPRVRGKGATRLRGAGLKVQNGLLKQEAARLNEAFFHFHRQGRPFVILKTAQTLDGRIATSNGDSRWVSSDASRKLVHHMRAQYDAVVVGSGTVKVDNPSLTVRHVKGRSPYRIMVTSSGKLPEKLKLLSQNKDDRTIIACPAGLIDRLTKKKAFAGVTFWEVKRNRAGRLDLAQLMERAVAFGLQSLLVEGGQTLATSLLRAGLVDKLVTFIAPRIVGTGIDALGDMGITKMSNALVLDRVTFEPCGPDIVVTGYPRRKP